jgi:hypothetical protein
MTQLSKYPPSPSENGGQIQLPKHCVAVFTISDDEVWETSSNVHNKPSSAPFTTNSHLFYKTDLLSPIIQAIQNFSLKLTEYKCNGTEMWNLSAIENWSYSCFNTFTANPVT